MQRLFFVSTAAPDLSEIDISQIAKKASENNARLEITGALAFNGVNFAQILEGEPDIVSSLLETIKSDKRHTGMIVVDSKTVSERAYDGWSMKRVEGLSFDEFLACMVDPEASQAD